MTAVSGLGLRNWQKVLYRLGLILPLLVGLQVLLVVLLMAVGLLPFELTEISAIQWASVWLGGACATALIVLRGSRLQAPRTAPHEGASALPAVVPLRVTHDCVLLARGRHFIALAFITFGSRWKPSDGRRMLEIAYQTDVPVTLTVARAFDEQEHIYLAVAAIGDNAESTINDAVRASRTVQQAFDQHGIEAQRVVDELGVEQLYWLCVLGKAFHEDVELRSDGRLVTARVGGNPLRYLATFALQPGMLEEPTGGRRLVGLASLMETRRPFFLAVDLKPIPPELVAQRLQQLAARTPEMTLLAEALGETRAIHAYAESQSPAMAEAATLLTGRKEGLWQTNYRLICCLTDAPVLTEGLALTSRLLGTRGFTETATTQVGSPGYSTTTSSLLNLLGQPKSQRRQKHERVRETGREWEQGVD